MSISRKIFNISVKIKEITSRKLFSTSLMLFLGMLLFFGTFNIYAASGGSDLQIEPAWEETKTFHNKASEADDEEDNMNSRNGVEFLNGAWTLIPLIAPEITPYQASANDGIPYDLKRGLLGMSEDAGYAVYAAYPRINIGEHLAQEWVPGYKDSVTSLYAASTSGYDELMNSGIAPMWTKALNISYVFFVLVMIGAGFMIMFRHKIGGQAMVTLGTVLPKVIISLILATFSFAIAGFIIDIGGIVTSLAAFVLDDSGDLNPISGIGGIMASVLGQDNSDMGFAVKGVVQSFGLADLLQEMTSSAPLGLSAMTLAIVSYALPPIGFALGTVGLIIVLIILAIIFFGAIKVLWTLYKAYFGLLIAVILGPLQITFGAIPGNTNAVKNWLFSIIRNVMVFPVVFFVINLPNMLANSGMSMILKFPDKLSYDQSGAGGGVDAGGVLNAIFRIFVLYFAAQAPKFLETMFPPDNSKAAAEGMAAARGSLSKIPLIGSMFK
jgi:hypothetical protein